MPGIESSESSPKSGTASRSDATIKARKEIMVTKAANNNCGKGFIPLKAVNAMTINFPAKIKE